MRRTNNQRTSIYQEINERLEGDCAVVLHKLVVYQVHVLILRRSEPSVVQGIAREGRLTEYTIPRLARAADISDWLSVFDSSLSKYRNVLSNCSSCAGVRLVMLRDTICNWD